MEAVTAEEIPENMLQVLYAMANESRRERPRVYDAKAVEIVKRLEEAGAADAAAKKGSSVPAAEKAAAGNGIETCCTMGKGALARTILLDRMTADYIRRHPDGTVINIACGLDTRFYRVDNGRIHWYELDLPETIEIRRHLLPEEERVSLIGKSALDETWPEDVREEKQALILMERLTMYMSGARVRKMFEIIAAHFDRAEVYAEIASPYTVKNTYENVDGASRLKYTWGAENGRQLQLSAAGFRAVRDVSLMEGLMKLSPVYHVLRFFPPMRRISNKIAVLRRE